MLRQNYAQTETVLQYIFFILILLLKFEFETKSFSLVLSQKESSPQFFIWPIPIKTV